MQVGDVDVAFVLNQQLRHLESVGRAGVVQRSARIAIARKHTHLAFAILQPVTRQECTNPFQVLSSRRQMQFRQQASAAAPSPTRTSTCIQVTLARIVPPLPPPAAPRAPVVDVEPIDGAAVGALGSSLL